MGNGKNNEMVSLFRTAIARGDLGISEGSTTAEGLGSKKEGANHYRKHVVMWISMILSATVSFILIQHLHGSRVC